MFPILVKQDLIWRLRISRRSQPMVWSDCQELSIAYNESWAIVVL